MEPFTLGAEEEYQLVDPRSGALVSRAREVLAADWAAEAQPESQATMIEVQSQVCASTADLAAELRRLRFHAATAAAAQDLALVAAGVHPFSRWEDQEPTPDPRYRRLFQRYGRVLESEHVFGMHIHVAVEPGTDRMAIVDRLRPFLPHLIALSASSPLLEGRETGYESYRNVLTDRLPGSGPPPTFRSEAEYESFVARLTEVGVLEDRGSVYWSIRPHHAYPTVEIRCPDVCPRLSDAVAIAALARALVVAAAWGRLPAPDRAWSASLREARLRSECWQAARFGLGALVAPRGDGGKAGERPLWEDVRVLLDEVGGVADELGDADALDRVSDILGDGNGAERIREAHIRVEGDLPALVAWLAEESLRGTGLEGVGGTEGKGSGEGRGGTGIAPLNREDSHPKRREP